LHLCHEQARCLFHHRGIFFLHLCHEQARCLFHNRGIFFLHLCHEQARCLFHNRGIFFLHLCHEQARCLFHTRCLFHNRGIFFLVGWARERAPKSLIENGATYEFQATLAIMTYPKNSFGANNYVRIFFARPAAAAIEQRSG